LESLKNKNTEFKIKIQRRNLESFFLKIFLSSKLLSLSFFLSFYGSNSRPDKVVKKAKVSETSKSAVVEKISNPDKQMCPKKIKENEPSCSSTEKKTQ